KSMATPPVSEVNGYLREPQRAVRPELGLEFRRHERRPRAGGLDGAGRDARVLAEAPGRDRRQRRTAVVQVQERAEREREPLVLVDDPRGRAAQVVAREQVG